MNFFTVFVGSYDDATRSVRVRKKNKTAFAGKTELELKELSESAQMYIQSVIEGLDLGDGQFLLAVAWATESAVRFHELYPSIMGVDVVCSVWN